MKENILSFVISKIHLEENLTKTIYLVCHVPGESILTKFRNAWLKIVDFLNKSIFLT